MGDSILCARDGEIATVTINRPDKRNALDRAAWIRLAETFDALSEDESLRCVIIRGAGSEAFGAGADISGFDEERSNARLVEEYEAVTHRAMEAMVGGRHPVVAMIHGFCLGGAFELATGCDIRVSGESGRFGIPAKRMGLFLGHPMVESLVHVVGRATALEMLLEARIYDADEALRKALVHRVVPDAALEEETMATARRIAEGAPLAARFHRRAVRRVADPAPLTAEEIAESFSYADSEDYHTGYRAFLAKEKPRFKGR